MENPTPQSACPGKREQHALEEGKTPEKKFFLELTLYLGMALDNKARLEANRLFSGPSGLLCRVQTRQDKTQLSARPEVMLPLTLAGLDGEELRRLMTLQAAALSELGWYVGPSHEGFVAVCPLRWTQQAEVVASELDVGNVLGKMVLDFMSGETPDMGAPVFGHA